MKKIPTLSLLITLSLALAGFAHAETEEITPEIRSEAAAEKLAAETQAVTLFVKEMSCAGCAGAIRDELTKLDFIDQSRLEKGVDIDVEKQLATIAVKDGMEMNLKDLTKAIDEAGFAAALLYTMEDGKLTTKALASSAS